MLRADCVSPVTGRHRTKPLGAANTGGRTGRGERTRLASTNGSGTQVCRHSKRMSARTEIGSRNTASRRSGMPKCSRSRVVGAQYVEDSRIASGLVSTMTTHAAQRRPRAASAFVACSAFSAIVAWATSAMTPTRYVARLHISAVAVRVRLNDSGAHHPKFSRSAGHAKPHAARRRHCLPWGQ